MKEIKAYVHRNRVAAVIQALKDSPVFGGEEGARRANLSAYMVKGSLLALDKQERHFSLDLGEETIDEYKLEFLCEDTDVEALVAIIRQSAHTGQCSSGWIYVINLETAIKIA